MFYVPDGTQCCGFYECKACGERFLETRIAPILTCPYCGEEPDMEIGPDDEMPENTQTAELLEVLDDPQEIEKMDSLLSLAITGGDCEWI